jgi:ATP-dependent RNA helicase DDX23/PRP28
MKKEDATVLGLIPFSSGCFFLVVYVCSFVVQGFAPQLESILDAMGGTLKSEKEEEAYLQEEADRASLDKGLPKHRLTAMFTATMPMEVEQMAKRYLRHPAVVSIGDQHSGKNARIVQRVIFLSSPAQKEAELRKLVLDPRFLREKVMVFVNEKKHADGVGRMIERFGRRCVVLHGGKSQEQREENLGAFRQGGVVLVATDVAGRGLDIADVAHVINYDLPTRSIDSYSHRVGRTGRAGKEGLATSLMTPQDEGIMAPLKAYLESTGNPVPDKLARHPAANGSVERNLIY